MDDCIAISFYLVLSFVELFLTLRDSTSEDANFEILRSSNGFFGLAWLGSFSFGWFCNWSLGSRGGGCPASTQKHGHR